VKAWDCSWTAATAVANAASAATTLSASCLANLIGHYKLHNNENAAGMRTTVYPSEKNEAEMQ
jgi:hypothetical protein